MKQLQCATTKNLKKTNQPEIDTQNNTAVRSTKLTCWHISNETFNIKLL